jgi:hypothetical protein
LGRAGLVFTTPAQIRFTTDVSGGLDRSLTVAREEGGVEAVQAWLSEIVGGAQGLEDNPDGP